MTTLFVVRFFAYASSRLMNFRGTVRITLICTRRSYFLIRPRVCTCNIHGPACSLESPRQWDCTAVVSLSGYIWSSAPSYFITSWSSYNELPFAVHPYRAQCGGCDHFGCFSKRCLPPVGYRVPGCPHHPVLGQTRCRLRRGRGHLPFS